MAIKHDYEHMDTAVLETTARIMGDNSAAAGALRDMARRQQSGQVPAAVQARRRGAREGTLLVFDARQPPDFLPEGMRAAYVEVASGRASNPKP